MHTKTVIILISFFLLLSKAPSYAHAEDDNKFRFAVMGCMHLGVCNFKDYELAIEKIKEYKPDFMLFLGGMVDPMVDKPVESLWQRFDRITEKLEVPVYDVLGNCKVTPFVSIPKDKIASMEKCFLDRYKKRYYSFEHKNNLFVVLDSEGFFKNPWNIPGVVKQTAFINEALSQTEQYNNVFIALHDSFWLQDEQKSGLSLSTRSSIKRQNGYSALIAIH